MRAASQKEEGPPGKDLRGKVDVLGLESRVDGERGAADYTVLHTACLACWVAA